MPTATTPAACCAPRLVATVVAPLLPLAAPMALALLWVLTP